MRLSCNQDEVASAQPEIDEKTASLVSKGKWMPPGYKVCGIIHLSPFANHPDAHIIRVYRSASAICLPSKNWVRFSIPPIIPHFITLQDVFSFNVKHMSFAGYGLIPPSMV